LREVHAHAGARQDPRRCRPLPQFQAAGLEEGVPAEGKVQTEGLRPPAGSGEEGGRHAGHVPALEDSLTKVTDKRPTQREVLAIHREDAMCASCHARMDPLGLAMENFNGFGRFRTMEFQQPIDPAGELITGEKFTGVLDLKQSLVKNHKLEFYRTLTGKLLTYVLGRGTEYYDVATIARWEHDGEAPAVHELVQGLHTTFAAWQACLQRWRLADLD